MNNIIDQMLNFYRTAVSVDTVPVSNVNYNEFYVQSGFTEALINKVIEPCYAANKIPMFVFNDAANKCGIAAERLHKRQIVEFDIPVNEVFNGNADIAVVNLLQYNGWFSQKVLLMSEIAEMQWYKNGIKSEYQSTPQKDKMLFTDYLLSTAICYVEIFNDNSVDKFLATRNINLLAQLSTMYKDVDTKTPYLRLNKDLSTAAGRRGYQSYLAWTSNNINNGAALPYLKLNWPTKKTNTYNIVMPRGENATLNAGKQYRITPAFMLIRQNKFMHNLLTNNVVTLEYLKDNLQIRRITTTGNQGVLASLLENDTERIDSCVRAFNGIGGLAGFYKLPDIDLLKSDSCMRVVNQRICKFKINTPAMYKQNAINFDLMQVPDVFKMYLRANSTNHSYLQFIMYLLESIAYQSWIEQSRAEYSHYAAMSKVSKAAASHCKLAQYILAEINNRMLTTQRTVEFNTKTKSAEQIYVELLACVTDNVKQQTTAYCKQLYRIMAENPNAFPNYQNYIHTHNVSVGV